MNPISKFDIEVYDTTVNKWAQSKYLVHGRDVLWTDDIDEALSFLKNSMTPEIVEQPRCEICGNARRSYQWFEAFNQLEIRLDLPDSNPLGKYGGNYQEAKIRFQLVCPSCNRKIAEAIDKAIKSIVS